MGTLYLVRHGQASFGADNYDQLSPLGHEQGVRLGRYWARTGFAPDAVITGTLQRQRQTWAAIREGLGEAADALQAVECDCLNEYDSDAVIRAIYREPLPAPDTPELYRAHFHRLRDGLTQWMAGTVSPEGMPSYDDFARGVATVLAHVREHHLGQRVLVVSSGGPIATAVGQVLGTSPETTINLNMRIRNSAVSQTEFNARRHSLITFNALPHLGEPGDEGLMTYT